MPTNRLRSTPWWSPLAALGLATALAVAPASAAGASADAAAIVQLLKRYETALNASDVEAVMPLYTPDGVFMPQHSPSSVGTAALRAAYGAVFKAIKLDVRFDIVEVVVTSADWAFARTNSLGSVRIHASGHSGPAAHQELFVLKKSGANWRIARYGFSTTLPPRQ